MVDMANEFSEILKRLRYDRNLTQAEMAEKVDISLRHYQGMEAGASEPGLAVIKKIINGLNLEPGEILGYARKYPLPKSNATLIKVIEELQSENDVLPKDIQEWIRTNPPSEGQWANVRTALGLFKTKDKKKSQVR